ncbi:MAG: LCP family protein [Actinobacteria bacterium]|nr:LCP family protein [Actinomycetota bacterium]
MKKNDYTFKNSLKRSDRRRRGYPPPSESGFRKARLTAQHRLRRRRTARLILLSGAVISLLMFAAVFMTLRSRGSVAATPDSGSIASGAGTVIITGNDEEGRLSQLAVLVPENDGGFGLFTIPARTVSDTPGRGFQELDHITALGGQELLDQTVANLLQVPIQYHINLNYGVLDLALAQAGTINFRTDRAQDLSAAAPPVHLTAGDNPTSAANAMIYLKASAADGLAGPRVQSLFYQGLRDSLALKTDVERRGLAALIYARVQTDMDEGDFTDLILGITTQNRPFGAYPLPVKIAVTGSDWYLEPVPAEIETLMTGTSRDAAIALEVRNGTETPGLVEAAADRLAPLRYTMTQQPDPSGVNFDSTQIRVGSDVLAAGNRVRDALGTGTIIKDDNMEKRQIIVIMGRDVNLALLQKR